MPGLQQAIRVFLIIDASVHGVFLQQQHNRNSLSASLAAAASLDRPLKHEAIKTDRCPDYCLRRACTVLDFHTTFFSLLAQVADVHKTRELLGSPLLSLDVV